MNIIKKLTIAFCSVILLSQLTFAQMERRIPGTGEVNVEKKSIWGNPDPSDAEKNFAFEKAKENVLDNYAASLSTSERALFERQREHFIYNINNYVKNVDKVKAPKDNSTNKYSVKILADIDVGKLRDDIRKYYNSTPSKSTQGVAQDDAGYVAFFAVRSVEKLNTFDEKRTKINKETSINSIEQTLSDDALSASEKKERLSIKETGGSREQKSDKQVLISNETIVGEFTAALTGYILDMDSSIYIADGSFFESSALVQSLYGQGKALDNPTWRKILGELRDFPEIKYAILGTVTFSAKKINENTGQDEQDATVTVFVYDISRAIPRMITNIEPISLKGVGNTQAGAEKDAMVRAAKVGAEQIFSKVILRTKE